MTESAAACWQTGCLGTTRSTSLLEMEMIVMEFEGAAACHLEERGQDWTG